MKKLVMIFLCLMMVLPLHAFAEETGSQPQAQVENQPAGQSDTQTTEQSGTQTPETQPGTQTPETQPGTQTPETQPGTQTPETQPGTQTPETQPGTQTPETQPDTQTPETQPGTQTPETQPSDHKHVWDVSYTVPATCKEEGATAYGCSACGTIAVEVLPKLEHKFSTQWSRNASGHWHACSACGEKADFGSHYPGPAATEEKAQICLTCGITLTAKLGHTHKYDTQWTSDETGHWYACSGCDDQKDLEDHTYDDGCDPDCNVCGYASSTVHSYSGTWLNDETGHWDVCTICQEASTVEPHIPGPDATETEAQVCLACSFELTPAPLQEHVHEAEGPWVTDGENHWRLCACGEKTEAAAHLWDAGEEQEDRTVLYSCEDCGFTRTEGKPGTGISPLVWMGAAIIALLSAAAVILFLLIPRVSKGGKHVR